MKMHCIKMFDKQTIDLCKKVVKFLPILDITISVAEDMVSLNYSGN